MKLTIEINGEKRVIDLGDDLVRALKSIADRNGLTLEAALQQAITNEKFIEDEELSGARFLIEKDDKLRELIRVPA